jgi:DNA-directed RNA polymerase subunit alpha
VENTREGQVLDYDKLTLDIETDGSVTRRGCRGLAARILQDQLGVFVNFEEPQKEVDEETVPNWSFNPRFSRRSTNWNFRCVRPTA